MGGLKKRYFHVDIHYACFGMISLANVVAEVAPIASWMKGKSLKEVKPWLLSHKAKVTELNNSSYVESFDQKHQTK